MSLGDPHLSAFLEINGFLYNHELGSGGWEGGVLSNRRTR
jgi:hypothetical protein